MKTLSRSLLALTLIASLAGCMVTSARIDYQTPRYAPIRVVPAYAPPPYYLSPPVYRPPHPHHRRWH